PLREARLGGAAGRDAVLHHGRVVRRRRARDPEGAMIPDAWRRGGSVVAVVGLGKSGVAATKLLAREGARVYASDASDHPYGGAAVAELRGLAGVEVDVGRHDLAKIRSAAGVVVSPGVPPDAAPLAAAREAGVPVVSEIGILTNLAPDHLDRYPSVDAYYHDKQLLFSNARPRDVWVLNGDDPAALELPGPAPGRRVLFSLRRPADGWYDPAARRLR